MNLVWSCMSCYLIVLICCSSLISVSAAPMISKHPNGNGNITVVEGSNVTLKCTATGDGKLNYQWRRVSGSLPNNSRVRNNGNLNLFNITVNDSGQYYCNVSDTEGSVSSMKVQVTARRRPSVSGVTGDQQLSIVSDNEEVILTCNVNGDDITDGYWERVNDDPLPNNMSSLSNDKRTLAINISSARPTHSGRYRCVVYSQWGVAQSSNVQVTITIAPPSMTRATRQPNNRITALQDVTFTCTAKGYEVKYEWRYHENNSIIGRGFSYTISRATPLDEDQYYCVAMTEGGYAFSNNITLRVNDDISIGQHPHNATLATGNMLTLSIIANGPGNNKFTYQWKRKDGTSLPDRASGKRTSNLTITSVTPSDSGSYYCIVMNQWGNMVKSNDAIVIVHPLPEITKHPNESGPITVAEGSDVMLNCKATGKGKLNYQWKRVSGSLPISVRMSNREQTLIIRNIAVSDNGQYYCEVDNGGDSVSSMRVQVTARRRPSVSGVFDDQMLGIVSGNEQVMLTCNVNGDDITDGYWERVNDNPLPVSNNMSSLSNDKRTLTITISSARPTHSGRYHCVVYSQWGVAQSRNVQVTITIAPPMITRQPTNQMIVALQDVTFTCTAKGYEVNYEWRHHKNNSIIGRGSTYTISKATPLVDEDQYYCVAMTKGGYAFSHNVTLRVNDQLSIKITSTLNPVAVEGGIVMFTAKASGINKRNFKYQWKRRGKNNIPTKASGVKRAVLRIPKLKDEDEGQYYCTVTNEWNNKEVSKDVTLTVKANLPLFWRHPSDQIVDNHQTATFECFVNGSDSINVIWEKNGGVFSSGNKNVTIHNSTNGVVSSLTLDRAVEGNSGKYRCKATNADDGSTVSMEAELIIRPQILTNLSDITIFIGESAQLTCRAFGTDIVYRWMKDGMMVSSANSNILRIINIMESDEGMYECVVSNSNDKGDTVKSNAASITVYGPPTVKKPSQQQLYVVLGEQLQITCTATNDQDAPMNLKFSWRTPNSVMFNMTKPDEDDSRTATSTLHINAVTHNHNGMYTCIVSNGEHPRRNNVKATFTVVIEEQSSPPVNFSIAYINPTSFQLKWSSPKYSNGSIDYYTVYYEHDQSKQAVNVINFNGTYTLDNLAPYTEYSVYVTAVRLIGGDSDRPLEGMKSATLIEKTLAGKPEITEMEVDQSMPEIILNLNSSMASRGSTFDIDLPQISSANGPFSHFYIIVVINSSAINGQALTTQELLEHSMNNFMLLYIVAVVNASQYVQYAGGYRMKYILGAGDNTTDVYGHVFHNREVKSEYSFFYRVFSANSTLENEIYSNSEIRQIPSPQQSTGASSSGSNAAGPVIGVIVALLLIIAVIIIVILLLFLYKKKYSKTKDTGLSKVVPTDAGIQLNNKEIKDEDAKQLPPLAATNPFPQETSFSPNSPLPMEVTTSVGQPTTLFVELPYADDSEITWQKDGKSVSHPVLPDGSLYIANTKISDQGDYTVTATATDNTTSEMLKLIVIDPKIPTTLSDHKPVKVEDFPEHIALMQSKKSIQFEEDYEAVMMEVALSQHAAKLHVNASKNRYKNIVPYDHCRVVLTQQGQKPGSDYVNGSFVDGYKEPKAYIATQGPVSNTVDDFWRMIWEHNVTTIVMLTRLVEDSKIKCHQYWPESESAIYGNFKVTITKHEVIAKYCIRNFIIEKTSEHKSREVCQFHFTAWPDHGVPKYGTDILEFQKRIDKYHKRKDGKPMVVHCSAGVGRTGTFIAIDIEIQRINHESLVDVYNCVCRLRFWRNYMVQTVDQYTLIFTALLEHIACGDTSIAAPTKSVQDKVKELSAVDPHTKKTGFETQFETLTKNSPKEKEFAYSVASKNKSKNRNKKCLPPDTSRVHLSKVGDKSDYINACHIDGYRHCKEFLVGPGPMESTSADFWRMIWEKQSHAIVMLGQLKENGEEASFQYWPKKDDKCEYGNLTVQTTSEDPVDDNVTKRVMKVTHKETSVTRTITQLQYVEWPQNSAPSNSNSIIDLTEILERVQRKTANGPITVHCSDGMGRSGTFCALVVSINRFKAEQMVDVFKTIITMRSQRPGLVANAEQYKFIHEAIINMLLRFATYSNFSNENTITDGVYENLPSSSM